MKNTIVSTLFLFLLCVSIPMGVQAGNCQSISMKKNGLENVRVVTFKEFIDSMAQQKLENFLTKKERKSLSSNEKMHYGQTILEDYSNKVRGFKLMKKKCFEDALIDSYQFIYKAFFMALTEKCKDCVFVTSSPFLEKFSTSATRKSLEEKMTISKELRAYVTKKFEDVPVKQAISKDISFTQEMSLAKEICDLLQKFNNMQKERMVDLVDVRRPKKSELLNFE